MQAQSYGSNRLYHPKQDHRGEHTGIPQITTSDDEQRNARRSVEGHQGADPSSVPTLTKRPADKARYEPDPQDGQQAENG